MIKLLLKAMENNIISKAFFSSYIDPYSFVNEGHDDLSSSDTGSRDGAQLYSNTESTSQIVIIVSLRYFTNKTIQEWRYL